MPQENQLQGVVHATGRALRDLKAEQQETNRAHLQGIARALKDVQDQAALSLEKHTSEIEQRFANQNRSLAQRFIRQLSEGNHLMEQLESEFQQLVAEWEGTATLGARAYAAISTNKARLMEITGYHYQKDMRLTVCSAIEQEYFGVGQRIARIAAGCGMALKVGTARLP